MGYGKYQGVVDHAQSVLDAHDFAHTCRVLNYALQILNEEKKADQSVVVLAAILHDIGRESGSAESHANTVSEKSKAFLVEQGYAEELAERVADCILKYSNDLETAPQTKEAKILSDADKLDKTGAVGSARAIIECKLDGKPLYTVGEDGLPLPGSKDESESLLQIHRRNLRKLKKDFYTEKAKKIAAKRQQTMDEYFLQLEKEVGKNYTKGNKLAQKFCV